MHVNEGLLSGSVSGRTRKELVTQAENMASNYFETKCVRVSLIGETSETDRVEMTDGRVAMMVTTFSADFRAEVWHDIEVKSHGPNRCLKCNADSWPQNPLNGGAS